MFFGWNTSYIFQRLPELAQMNLLSSLFSIQVLSSDAATSKANGSLFDGSYLGLAAARARQPQEHRSGNGGRGEAQTSSNPASLSCASELSPNDGPINMHRQPHMESCYRCERCQASGQDSGYGTQQRRPDNSSRLEKGQHDALNPHDCERYSHYSPATFILLVENTRHLQRLPLFFRWQRRSMSLSSHMITLPFSSFIQIVHFIKT